MNVTPCSRQFVPLQYEAFLGLDVDKSSIAVTVVDHEGTSRSLRMPYNAEHLIRYIRKHVPGTVALAYESGPTGYGLYDDLSAAGYYCMVIAASRMPHIDGQCVKTNRLDSKRIAEALRGGQVKSINIPSPAYRNLRHLVQLREVYAKQVSASKTRIKMLLLYEGIAFPAPEGASWSARVITGIENLPCQDTVRFKLNALLSNLRYNKEQLLLTMRHIRSFWKRDEEIARNVRLLLTIPGIGQTTAVAVLARMGDWRYVRNVRHLASFLGLVPRESSTGDTVRRGSITRAGHHRTRNKLIQCAWIAIRKDPELRAFYERLCRHYGKRDAGSKKAIVAVSRKLTTRIYAVLRNQRPYIVRADQIPDTMTPEMTQTPQGTTRAMEEPASSLTC
jgi:transposase